MTNVVIDMSNMLFRSMFVLGGFSGPTYSFDNQKELDELMRKLATDISFLVRMVNPSRVIFALDAKSWRKDINIEENEGYKGQRKKDKHLNWDNVFDTLDKFMDICEDNGMIVTKIKKAEADDVIALWRDELLFNQKQHFIAISGDEDIRQLVTSYVDDSGKPIFATVFNPFKQGKNAARKLYVPEGFSEWVKADNEEASIWNMDAAIDIDKGDFRRIRDTDDVRVEVVDGNLIAMKKVFCGDDGDNIPSIYTWLTKIKSGPNEGKDKEVRITEKAFEKIYSSLQNSPNEHIDHYDLLENHDKILKGITKIAKQAPPFDLEERLIRQIKLVVLDKANFPESILEKFEEIKNEPLLKPRPEIGNLNMNAMLQGTRYIKTKSGGTGTGNVSGIFNQIDKMNSKSLF